jgi:tellurite resistance protein TehA-like permease
MAPLATRPVDKHAQIYSFRGVEQRSFAGMHSRLHIGGLHRLGAWMTSEIAGLYPGCFALVMASGIISNGLFLEGHPGWSDLLFAVILFAYPFLILLTLIRFTWFPRALWADLMDPALVFSFFTLVAGTGVLAVALNLRGWSQLALSLWAFAFATWLVLIYLGFAVMIFRNPAGGADIAHGGWLNAIVGTESLVILGMLVAPQTGDLGSAMLVAVHMLWGVGIALYGIFIALFAQRIFFFNIEPDDISPVLWVVMGAAAITTNAGSTLILARDDMTFLLAMRPLIDGLTLVMWAWATWWIPMLLLLGMWKHGVRRVPLRYTPMLWSLVFPLGMYAVASLRLSMAANLPALRILSDAMIWIALAAWIATALAFVHACWRHYRTFDDPRLGQS